MKYNFENTPGYSYQSEAEVIYKLVEEIDSKDIFEAGCFTGKLTIGLARKFPERNITAIDVWGNIEHSFKDIIGETLTIDTFINYTREYPNICGTIADFFNIRTKHDIVILSIDGKKLDWAKVMRHAIRITNKRIIGRHAYITHRKPMCDVLNQFDITHHGYGVYSYDIK